MALCALGLPSILGAQGRAEAAQRLEPAKPAGFPAIETLIERTSKLRPGGVERYQKTVPRQVLGVSLPQFDGGLDRIVELFDRSAVRAIRATYEDDHDDPAVLLSLQAKLSEEKELEPARRAWAPLLDKALLRARALESVRLSLHALRRAFQRASFDDYYGIYKNIDIGRCLRATSKALATLDDLGDLSITVEPVGHQDITTFQTLCRQALQVELAERRFPKALGTSASRAEVAKAYRRFAPDEQLLKISVPKRWQRDGSVELLEAAVGVEFPSEEHGFRCAIVEVTLARSVSPSPQQSPTCCDLQKTIPINCKELRQ